MKGIYFAIALAMLVFSACSEDDEKSSGSGNCLLKMNGANFECIEGDDVYGSKQVCDGMKGEWVNSCPPGGVKCEAVGSGDIPFVATFYTEPNPCSEDFND